MNIIRLFTAGVILGGMIWGGAIVSVVRAAGVDIVPRAVRGMRRRLAGWRNAADLGDRY